MASRFEVSPAASPACCAAIRASRERRRQKALSFGSVVPGVGHVPDMVVACSTLFGDDAAGADAENDQGQHGDHGYKCAHGCLLVAMLEYLGLYRTPDPPARPIRVRPVPSPDSVRGLPSGCR